MSTYVFSTFKATESWPCFATVSFLTMVSLSMLISILVPVSDVVTLIVFSEELTLLLSIFSSILVSSLVTLPIASSTEVPDLISNDVPEYASVSFTFFAV